MLPVAHKCGMIYHIPSHSPREITPYVFFPGGTVNQTLTDIVIANIGWIIALTALLISIGSILISIGALKQRIASADASATKLKRELYDEDGVTNYIPRRELLPMLDRLNSKVIAVREEIYSNCSTVRAECRQAVCGHIDLVRQDNQRIQEGLEALEEKYHDQALGFVALSTQMSLLLKHAQIPKPDEIHDIERRLRKSAKDRLRRYNDEDILNPKEDKEVS